METVRKETSGPRVRFAPFELDLETLELTRDGRRLDLAPQPSRVLALLVSRAGRLVERSELRREIWGDSWREWETGLHQAIRRIRVVLGDSAASPVFIETVPRRGYRLIAEVESVHEAVSFTSPPERPEAAHRSRPAWAAALVAVLLLSLILAPGVPGTAVDPAREEAHRLYEEGRYLLVSGKIPAALAKLHRAVEMAPAWAEPWNAIAEAELARPGAGRVDAARRALESALVRDPDDGRSWLLLARLRMWQEWDWSGARRALRRSLLLDPDDPDVWQLLSALETVSDRPDEALAAARRAMRLDPVSTALAVDLGWTLYYSGRPEEALAECQRTFELAAENVSALQSAVQALLVLGREAEAAVTIVRAVAGRLGELPSAPSGVLAAYWQAQLAALAGPESCASAAALALPRIASGDTAGALDALADGAREHKGWEVPFARVDPLFAKIHGDARFAAVDEALGFDSERTYAR